MAHYIVHSAQCTVHTAHRTLHTAHYIVHSAHCTLHTAHYIVHGAHCVKGAVKFYLGIRVSVTLECCYAAVWDLDIGWK